MPATRHDDDDDTVKSTKYTHIHTIVYIQVLKVYKQIQNYVQFKIAIDRERVSSELTRKENMSDT